MQLTIAKRIKVFQTALRLKRQRGARSNTQFSSLHRGSQCSYSYVRCIPESEDVLHSSQIAVASVPFTPTSSIKNHRWRVSHSLYPDHYRSYSSAQSPHYNNSQQPPQFSQLSSINNKKARTRSDSSNLKYDATNQTLNRISNRLSFFFSDANLRHDSYARQILEINDNRYLPLDVIMAFKSIQKLTGDPNDVLYTVDYMNSNDNKFNVANPIKLRVHTTESGEISIGRVEPFIYHSSIKEAQQRIMLIEGWPSDEDTRDIENRVLTLLCAKSATMDKSSNYRGKNLIAYRNTDIGKGVMTIEFQTDEGAAEAWSNLARATASKEITSHQKNPNQFVVKVEKDVEGNTEYHLRVRNLSLVAKSISIVDETSTDDVNKIVHLIEQSSISKQHELEQHTSPVTSPSIANQPSIELKWWTDGTTTPSLNKCVEAMDKIFLNHDNLPPPSREWLHEYSRGKNKRKRNGFDDIDNQLYNKHRTEICNDALHLISCIKRSIEEGKIRGLGGKDAYLLSDLLGRAMIIFSETPPPQGTHSRGRSSANSNGAEQISPYEACLGVIDILKSLNLDVLSSHYACTIRAACHEARWKEASSVFLSQINGNEGCDASENMATGGFSPINPTLGWDQPLEIGLYAVARNAWYESLLAEQQGTANHVDSPSKQVFDTAIQMCMISPSEQDSYILAAGSALGRAGLWSECLDLATEPSSIATYGPSITAAALLACIESGRHNEAIDSYDYFMSGNQSVASEWQWSGGNITAVEPVCRDLALTAMGNISRGGYSEEAQKMFEAIMDEGSPLSCEGLLGLVRSLENDGKWKAAVEVLDRFMSSNFNSKRKRSWQIVPDIIHLQKETISGDGLATDREVATLLENIVASVMRACNIEGHFGLAAVLCAVANKKCYGSKSDDDLMDADVDRDAGMLRSDAVFEAYLHSLCGLGCKRVAEQLNSGRNGAEIDEIVFIPKRMRQNLPNAESWIEAEKSINCLLEAKNAVLLEREDLCPASLFLFGRGLARAMILCNDSNQPTAALYLLQNTAGMLKTKNKKGISDQFKTFLGMKDQMTGNSNEGIFSSDGAIELNGIEMTDSLLAAIINAHIKNGQPERALATYNSAMSDLEAPHLMSQSSNCIMGVLLEMDHGECLNSVNDGNATPGTFIMIANHLANKGVWHEIGELYNKARRAGCISEELGFIAMKALNESHLTDGKIVVFRRIAEDIANTIGIDKDEWIKSRYWEIKRYVGNHYARVSFGFRFLVDECVYFVLSGSNKYFSVSISVISCS